MGRLLLIVGSAGAIFWASGIPLDACGDKLMLLGRGIRFQSRHTPRAAAVLLYVPDPGARAGTVSDPKLESALSEAGHSLRTAVNRQELDQALKSGQFDVVLADVARAADLQQVVQAAPMQPLLVPVVPKGSAAEKGALAQYGVVLKIPDRTGHYCHTVDQAMELKQKRDRRAGGRT